MTRPKLALRLAYSSLPLAVRTLADDMGLDADAAIGEGRIGGGHFERRHLRCAERDRGVRLELGDDPEAVRGLAPPSSARPRGQAAPPRC